MEMNTTQLRAFVLMIGLLSTIYYDTAAETPRVSTIRPAKETQVIKAQIDGRGTIHLLCQGKEGPEYMVSQDGGKTFSEPISILDRDSRRPGLEFQGEDLAIGKDGRVLVAMSNNAWKLKLPVEQWGFYYATLAHGAKEFAPTRNLNLKPSEGFSLAADQNGLVTAAFLSGKLFAKVSHDNGETFTANAEPNSAWNPCDCCTTGTAYGPDGKLAILYREETNNERDMYLVLWDQKAETSPVRTRVSRSQWKLEGCPMTYYSITATDSGYVAAWPTKGQIYFARLNRDGTVVPPGEIKTPGANGMRTGVLALGAKDGTSLVAWKKNDVLGWQLFGADGTPIDQADSAPSSGNGAAGVVLPDGKFLLFL